MLLNFMALNCALLTLFQKLSRSMYILLLKILPLICSKSTSVKILFKYTCKSKYILLDNRLYVYDILLNCLLIGFW